LANPYVARVAEGVTALCWFGCVWKPLYLGVIRIFYKFLEGFVGVEVVEFRGFGAVVDVRVKILEAVFNE